MEQNTEISQENQTGEISSQMENCDFCKNSTLNLDSFSCSHKICPVCLFRRFFIQDISELEGLCDSLVIKCGKCQKGIITKNLDDIIELSNKKNNIIKERKEQQQPGNLQKCQEHQLLKDYFCLDCCEHLCKKCKSNESNPHYTHSVMSVEKVSKNLKAEINNIPMKFKVKDLFEHNWSIISKNFKESSMENFNETLEQINELLKSLEEFKKEYEQKYKIELTKVVKTLKVLKLYYLDYYTEKDEALNGKDVESLRYINSIKNELVSMEMSKDVTFFQKLNDAKNIVDNLKTSSNKFNFNVKLKYEKLKYNYNFEYEIKAAHDKYITSLLVLNDDKILTTARDYSMKLWEEKTEQYTLDKKIEKRCGNVICVLPIENNKLLTSSVTNSTIYMWAPNPNEGLAIDQSLSLHTDIVLSMIRLQNGNLVSSGKDNTVIIWQKNEGGFYEEKQSIKEEKPILKLIALQNNKFGYTSDDGILVIMDQTGEGEEKKYEKICELNHEGRILCMCELKNGYIFTAGNGLNGKKNNHIYIWKPDKDKGYTHSQTLSGHKSDVNDMIQLKDGRIISSSRDRSLIIWKENVVVGNKNENNENDKDNKENKDEKNNDIKYMKSETLTEYPHGMFLLAQLRDGRICTSTSNNSVIFWRNWGSLPYC